MVGKYKIQLFLRLFISGDRIHRGACSSFIPEFIFKLLLGDDLHAHALKLCFYFPEFKQWFDIDHKSFVNRGSFCVRSIYLKHFKEVAPCPHIQMCHCSIPAFEDNYLRLTGDSTSDFVLVILKYFNVSGLTDLVTSINYRHS